MAPSLVDDLAPPAHRDRASPAGPTPSDDRSAYRFRLIRWANWREEGFLPLRNVTVSWQRGGIGRVDASLPLQAGTVPIRPAEQLLIVEENELPIWAGMIWAVDWGTGSAYATLRGSEWSSLLKRRRIRRDMRFEQMDQLDIVRSLVLEAQAGGGSGPADLHIDPWQGMGVEAPRSGILRDRGYLALERGEVYTRIEQLSQVIDGFDWYLRPQYRAGSLERTDLVFWLEFDYPPGQERSDLVLEYREGWPGSSVVEYRWPWDGSSVVNRAEAANDEQVATAEDPAAWTRYPLLEDLVQQGGEHGATRFETLMGHAEAFLLQNRLPRVTGSLILRSDISVSPRILGKRLRFRATSWRHPAGEAGRPGYDEELVVNSMSLSLPSDERAAQITLEVESEQWAMGEGGRPRGARGGGGRILNRGELAVALREMREQQDLAQANVRVITEQVDEIREVIEAPPPPPPPPPEPPPQPPAIETIVVVDGPVGATGQLGGNFEPFAANFNLPRGGSIRVEATIGLQAINWVNNEAMNVGTRRVQGLVVDGGVLWQSDAWMIGGGNPNWAQVYNYGIDGWLWPGYGGLWGFRWRLYIGGNNRIIVHGGWVRITFVG